MGKYFGYSGDPGSSSIKAGDLMLGALLDSLFCLTAHLSLLSSSCQLVLPQYLGRCYVSQQPRPQGCQSKGT